LLSFQLTSWLIFILQRFNGDKLSKFNVKLIRGNPANIKAAVPWADQNDVDEEPEDLADEGEELPKAATGVNYTELCDIVTTRMLMHAFYSHQVFPVVSRFLASS
jgi:hypothetical protein